MIDIEYIKKMRSDDTKNYTHFDNTYNIDTFHPIDYAADGRAIPGAIENSYYGSRGYQKAAEHEIKIINEFLSKQPNIEKYSFMDIGSGKGKVIFYNLINDAPYLSYTGIEIDPNLHSVAINNLNNINIHIDKKVLFINCNILDYEILNSPFVYFLFCPFTKEIFDQFVTSNLSKIKSSGSYLAFVNEYNYDVEKLIGSPPIFDQHSITIYK
jgi:SAM-dependent methyltransferase